MQVQIMVKDWHILMFVYRECLGHVTNKDQFSTRREAFRRAERMLHEIYTHYPRFAG